MHLDLAAIRPLDLDFEGAVSVRPIDFGNGSATHRFECGALRLLGVVASDPLPGADGVSDSAHAESKDDHRARGELFTWMEYPAET